jgi:tRNA threonylcarbamoyl adenosine modification protein (Sua5/YciO/YrdC/YwlC family)
MLLTLHPENPQGRLIQQAVKVLKQGGIIAYPTDSAYALGCHIGDKDALQRIQRIRDIDKNHFMTLVCRDLSELATYAHVDNWAFRLLKANTPGAYTFVLKATSEVPKRIMHQKRKTIGLRIPNCRITQALLEQFDEPIMSTTLSLPGEEMPEHDPHEIEEKLGNLVDLILDGGNCSVEPTTVVDLSENEPEIIRVGKGDPTPFN